MQVVDGAGDGRQAASGSGGLVHVGVEGADDGLDAMRPDGAGLLGLWIGVAFGAFVPVMVEGWWEVCFDIFVNVDDEGDLHGSFHLGGAGSKIRIRNFSSYRPRAKCAEQSDWPSTPILVQKLTSPGSEGVLSIQSVPYSFHVNEDSTPWECRLRAPPIRYFWYDATMGSRRPFGPPLSWSS